MEKVENGPINREKLHKEVPQLVEVLKEMKEGLDKVTSKVQFLTAKVKEKQFPTAEGISYLEAKHLLLISYCQSLVYYLLRKAEGLSIELHPVVRSLVEIRLFLEKIRPIDKKCGYLIERLLRTSATDAVKVDEANKGAEETQKSEDLLKYRPNPHNLIGKTDDHDDGLYRPPKITPVLPMGDGKKTKQERDALRKEENNIRKLRRDGNMRDYINDLEGRPEEVRDTGLVTESKVSKIFAEQWERRQEQEEEAFNRAPITKQDKRRLKEMKRSNGLLGLADDFNDELKALPLGDDADEPKMGRVGGSSSMKRKHNKRRKF